MTHRSSKAHAVRAINITWQSSSQDQHLRLVRGSRTKACVYLFLVYFDSESMTTASKVPLHKTIKINLLQNVHVTIFITKYFISESCHGTVKRWRLDEKQPELFEWIFSRVPNISGYSLSKGYLGTYYITWPLAKSEKYNVTGVI